MTAREREEKIRLWFGMGRKGTDEGIQALFAPDALYVEGWGPVPRDGSGWFSEWERGRDYHEYSCL